MRAPENDPLAIYIRSIRWVNWLDNLLTIKDPNAQAAATKHAQAQDQLAKLQQAAGPAFVASVAAAKAQAPSAVTAHGPSALADRAVSAVGRNEVTAHAVNHAAASGVKPEVRAPSPVAKPIRASVIDDENDGKKLSASTANALKIVIASFRAFAATLTDPVQKKRTFALADQLEKTLADSNPSTEYVYAKPKDETAVKTSRSLFGRSIAWIQGMSTRQKICAFVVAAIIVGHMFPSSAENIQVEGNAAA